MKAFILLLLFPFYSISQNTSFSVDDVNKNKETLKECSFEKLAKNSFSRNVLTYPDTLNQNEYVANRFHGFLNTIHLAFADHRPLELSPDDIWLTICQGFGHHVSVNQEELESDLLKEDHPDEIIVRNDHIAVDSQKWDDVIGSFTNEIQSISKDEFKNLLIKEFTTTTPVITTAYQATLMDVSSHYITYGVVTMCGIPSVTLLGTTEDWKKIYSDIDQFAQFGMGDWVQELKPVLQEFVNASEGNPNIEYWQSIYKNVEVYDKNYISGWVLKLFPYIVKDVSSVKTQYEPNPFLIGERYLLSNITMDDIPTGYTKTKFFWDDYTSEEVVREELMLCSGFIGIEQNSETMSIRPNIGWAICEADRPNDFIKDWSIYRQYADKPLKHKPFQWNPVATNQAKELPIYNPTKNKTFEQGINEIQRKLNSCGLFKLKDHPKITVEIARDGTAFVQNIKEANEKQKAYIIKYIEGSGVKWSPAKAISYDVISPNELLPTNYQLVLTI